MASNKGMSAFGNYGAETVAAEGEKEHLFTDADTHTHTDTHTDTEEMKTKRMFLLVRPSVAEKIQAAAKGQRISANELIHQLMEKYISDNGL